MERMDAWLEHLVDMTMEACRMDAWLAQVVEMMTEDDVDDVPVTPTEGFGIDYDLNEGPFFEDLLSDGGCLLSSGLVMDFTDDGLDWLQNPFKVEDGEESEINWSHGSVLSVDDEYDADNELDPPFFMDFTDDGLPWVTNPFAHYSTEYGLKLRTFKPSRVFESGEDVESKNSADDEMSLDDACYSQVRNPRRRELMRKHVGSWHQSVWAA